MIYIINKISPYDIGIKFLHIPPEVINLLAEKQSLIVKGFMFLLQNHTYTEEGSTSFPGIIYLPNSRQPTPHNVSGYHIICSPNIETNLFIELLSSAINDLYTQAINYKKLLKYKAVYLIQNL